MRAAALVGLALTGCGPQGDSFIASEADFAQFRSWTSFDRGVDPVPPSHLGHDVIYVDRLPPPGATEFPVGTRIVRAHDTDLPPSEWEIHAMVKRGGDFNAAGARGWEFFGLEIDSADQTRIEWRGDGPSDGDGYTVGDGGVSLGCNHCHGAATWNDSVLSPVLDLSARR